MRIAITTVCALLSLVPMHASALCEEFYGTDPLNPTRESLIGQYLQNTYATTVHRAFPLEENGTDGENRLVVSVSRSSFQEFQNLFVNDSILWIFHDPMATVLNVAFNGRKGFQARLNFEMDFTFSGATLIPICLTPAESARVKKFFQLTQGVPQSSDVALFPWLLKDSDGNQYMPNGNSRSLSEWFVRLPMGEEVDRTRTLPAYSMPNIDRSLHELLKEIWSAPHTHLSLKEVLNLRPFVQGRDLDTPGLIASSILANVSSERIPAVFRYVENHEDPLPADFNTWFYIDFNPDETSLVTLKEYLYVQKLQY